MNRLVCNWIFFSRFFAFRRNREWKYRNWMIENGTLWLSSHERERTTTTTKIWINWLGNLKPFPNTSDHTHTHTYIPTIMSSLLFFIFFSLINPNPRKQTWKFYRLIETLSSPLNKKLPLLRRLHSLTLFQLEIAHGELIK